MVSAEVSSSGRVVQRISISSCEKCLCDSKHSCTKSSSDLASDTYEWYKDAYQTIAKKVKDEPKAEWNK